MRQIALTLGLAAMAWSTATLSQPRKIAGIHARTVVSDGQFGYVDNGSTIFRLQRTEEGIRKLDSVGYEGNKSEASLYIPRDQTTGFLVFKDSVCSVDWRAVKDDRMMCTGGVSLGWGDYSGGITMGKLNVCGGSGAYTFQIYQTARPVLLDSLGGPDIKTCEVLNADQIEVRRGTDVMLFYRCLTVSECGDVPTTSVPTSRTYGRNRVASNGGNMVMLDSLGRLGLWISPPTPNVNAIAGFTPDPRKAVYLASSHQAGNSLISVGFDSVLVFGRRVDLGLEEASRIRFDNRVGVADLDKDALWMQVGNDIVSFDISESKSSLERDPSQAASRVLRHGRTLEVFRSGESGEIRILRPDGSVEARFAGQSSAVRWTAPGAGLRIVQMGKHREAVLIP